MARVDAKLLQIMPKLQILLDKRKVTFNNNNKRKRFRLLNFPRATILDFMTSLRCLYCWKAEVLLFETIGQRSDVMKSKMVARGKFKTRNLFRLLLSLNVTFPLYSKIYNLGPSPVLHCASLLHIILRVIRGRALENGGFFFAAGPCHGGKSPFSRK